MNGCSYPGDEHAPSAGPAATVTHFIDGSALMVERDGRRVLRHADGRTIVITRDGARIVRLPDGTTVMEEGPEMTRIVYNLAQSFLRAILSRR